MPRWSRRNRRRRRSLSDEAMGRFSPPPYGGGYESYRREVARAGPRRWAWAKLSPPPYAGGYERGVA